MTSSKFYLPITPYVAMGSLETKVQWEISDLVQLYWETSPPSLLESARLFLIILKAPNI